VVKRAYMVALFIAKSARNKVQVSVMLNANGCLNITTINISFAGGLFYRLYSLAKENNIHQQKGQKMTNYTKLIKDQKRAVNELTKKQLVDKFQELISNPQLFKVAGNLLENQGKQTLQDNLIHRHEVALMSGGEEQTDNSRIDNLLLGAIELGSVMQAVTIQHEVDVFASGYKKGK